MQIGLPQYTGKDYLVLAIVILPFTIGLNSIVFGSRYFTEPDIFTSSTLITGIVFSICFITCGAIAVTLKTRMPHDQQTFRRLLYMIVCFVGVSGISLFIIFNAYEAFPSFDYRFNKHGFIWSYFTAAIINIFLTLLMECIQRYEKWKENLKETEAIKKTFTQSQLMGLKSQVNPHFLFNSLNSLSSLIADDEKEAEIFLNEMSKVYRYMLRGDDEQLVPLQTELKFITSYTYLLNKRYGQSLQVQTSIQEQDLQKLIAPLSLQVLIENAFTQNSMSKTDPLLITISSKGGNEIMVQNNRQPKTITNIIDLENGLDNLVTKYRLLNGSKVVIRDEEKLRKVYLPLLQNQGGEV